MIVRFIMNLTPVEEHGLRSILKMIPKWDLIPLVSTITNGLVKTDNFEDAIKGVLKYCKDSLDVLKRKKITKDVLFRYLKESNVNVSPKSDKTELIHQCLRAWEVSSISSETIDWEMSEENEEPEYHNKSNNESNLQLATQCSDPNLNSMGYTFAKWFYDLLKQIDNDSIFGPQHFWIDCVCNALIMTIDGQCLTFSANGNNQTVVIIRQVVNRFCLQLEPNLYQDINCVMDSHGLIKISVVGILYKNCQPCGLFESLFGLIRDPNTLDTNWKIKCIEMRWKITSTNHQSLCS